MPYDRAPTGHHPPSTEQRERKIREGIIKGGEFGKVYALDFQPTLQEAKLIGARCTETVIRFSANSSRFVLDNTVSLIGGAYYTETNGLDVLVRSVERVGFR